LGHFPNITHAQAIYARAGGQFEQKIRIPIKWTFFNAGPTAIEALFADAIDVTSSARIRPSTVISNRAVRSL
jgi:NitT/TauT family transport system substrate-binding protein